MITSNKQSPKEEWNSYVTTTRAKANIKIAVKEEKKRYYKAGKEKLEKLFSQFNIEFSHENIKRSLLPTTFNSLIDLYYATAQDKISARDVKVFFATSNKNGWLNFLARSKTKPVTEETKAFEKAIENKIGDYGG